MGIGLIDRGSTCLLAGLLLAGTLLGVGSASSQSDPIIGAPGNVVAAMEQYRRALALVRTEPERRFILARLKELAE